MAKKDQSDKAPGFYFFPATWRGSEVNKCGYAEKGLWIDILSEMSERDPQGVIPGTPEEFADAMGYGMFPAAFWQEVEPLLLKLERANVFSRGAEIDPALDPDALVNRRMYRDWCKKSRRQARAKKAASVRWEGGTTKLSDAKGCLRPYSAGKRSGASAMLATGGDPVAGVGLTERVECLDGAREYTPPMLGKCHSEPDPTEKVFLGSLKHGHKHDLTGKQVFVRIMALTLDDEPWKGWWRRLVKAFDESGHLMFLEEQAQYVEDCLDPRTREAKGLSPIKSAARLLVSKVLEYSRKNGVAVPVLPKGANYES